jgi:hypothetical protein
LGPKGFEILRAGIRTAEECRLVNPPGVHDCGLAFLRLMDCCRAAGVRPANHEGYFLTSGSSPADPYA